MLTKDPGYSPCQVTTAKQHSISKTKNFALLQSCRETSGLWAQKCFKRYFNVSSLFLLTLQVLEFLLQNSITITVSK